MVACNGIKIRTERNERIFQKLIYQSNYGKQSKPEYKSLKKILKNWNFLENYGKNRKPGCCSTYRGTQ